MVYFLQYTITDKVVRKVYQMRENFISNDVYLQPCETTIFNETTDDYEPRG